MIDVSFDNIEKTISLLISSAEKRIYVAVAWFTNSILFDELSKALQRDVEVKVLILNDILNRNEFGLDFGLLVKNGAEVRYSKSEQGTMHNKFCVIDDKMITGSYNWTYHANENNENIVIIDEPDITNNFCDQFEILFKFGEPIQIPYEHLKWTDVKEGDFSELRRNIYRDVIAKNDINKELKRIKLINLNHAYHGGKKEDILAASSLPIIGSFKTITEVLTSRNRDYEFKLWEENILGKPYDNVEGHVFLEEWFFVPFEIKEDINHQKYVEGKLKVFTSRDNMLSKGLKLKVYDEDFIKAIITYCGSKSYVDYELIPINILKIDRAKLFYFPFPCPLYNKGASCTYNKRQPKTISAINVLGIVKEVNGDDVIFYEGWDPHKRGEKIVNQFFEK